MRSRRAAGLAGAALAALGLAAVGLAGPAGAVGAGAAGRPAGSVQAGVISTIAGGVGGPGLATSVAVSPCGLDWASGSLLIGDGTMVRRVSMATDVLTTVAGDNASGPVDDSGTAVSRPLSDACGTLRDAAGNLIIGVGAQVLVLPAKTGRFYGQAMTAGNLYPIAGSGAGRDGGPAGDGGPATKASLSAAVHVAFDRTGNLLIADAGYPSDCGEENPLGSLVRVVAARTGTFYGQKMTAGDIYTVAGVQSGGTTAYGGLATRAWLGVAIGSVQPDRYGNLVVADQRENDPCGVIEPSVLVIAEVTGTFYGVKMTAGHIYRVAGDGKAGRAGDGGPAPAASLALAAGAVVDGAGNLVIGDGSRVRVVAARTGRFYGQQMTVGHIYGIAGNGLGGYSGDGGPAGQARVAAGAVALDADGNVLFGGGHRVRLEAVRTGTFYRVKMTAGDIYTVAGTGAAFSGDGGPPSRAEFTLPTAVTVDKAGDIAFSAATVDGAETTTVDLIAASSGSLFGRRLTAGNLYTVAGNGIAGYRGDDGPAREAEFDLPFGAAAVAFDGTGNIVVADAGSNRVRMIAARSGRFFGQQMTAGDIYSIAGTGASGFSGDGGLAVKAKIGFPTGVAVDPHGNVVVLDSLNRRVRVVAAATGTFYGRAMIAGHIYTVAGDGSASFNGDGIPAVKAGIAPEAVGTDAAGNLIIADNHFRVRLVAVSTGTMYGQPMTAGDIYTIAGDGVQGSSGSGIPARQAEFDVLGGVTTDQHGNVIVPDAYTGLVWVVAVTDGTFYGQAMTAGDIYAIAGGGATLGAGGPATSALLNSPLDVAVTPAGSLLVTDGYDNLLRAVSP